MRWSMRCKVCGSEVISPTGRKRSELPEARKLVKQMGLRCRKCDGPVEVVEVKTALR